MGNTNKTGARTGAGERDALEALAALKRPASVTLKPVPVAHTEATPTSGEQAAATNDGHDVDIIPEKLVSPALGGEKDLEIIEISPVVQGKEERPGVVVVTESPVTPHHIPTRHEVFLRLLSTSIDMQKEIDPASDTLQILRDIYETTQPHMSAAGTYAHARSLGADRACMTIIESAYVAASALTVQRRHGRAQG